MLLVYIKESKEIYRFKNRIGVTSIFIFVIYLYSAFCKFRTFFLYFHCPMRVHRKLSDFELKNNGAF